MRPDAPPLLQVRGELQAALSAESLRSIGVAQWMAFLEPRRWFGAKGRSPSSVALGAVIPVEHGDFRGAVTWLDVTWLDVRHEDERVERYQLPLAVRADDGTNGGVATSVAIAHVDADGVRGTLIDAADDPAFRAALGHWLARGATFDAGGARWSVEARADLSEHALDAVPTRVMGAEQSNTSIVFGDDVICKLFRRLEPGENPDVEIGRFLAARATFAHVPALLATIHFETAAGERGVAGMAQRFLSGSVDAWTHALARIRPYVRAPKAQEPANPFAAEAAALGRVTRALHDALASDPADPDFAPVPATRDDVELWAEGVETQMEHAFELLDARITANALDPKTLAAARALLGRHESAVDRIDEITDELGDDAGMRIRHHGDYHLGQALYTRDGDWMVIDFEGEPARPLALRRERHSPLRDVAGMLRSFAYAAATGAAEIGGLGVDPVVETRSARWERDVRAAYLDGYFGGGANGAPALLPASREDAAELLALFEMEKVFYELAYELNNRPDWAWIPLRGIARLF